MEVHIDFKLGGNFSCKQGTAELVPDRVQNVVKLHNVSRLWHVRLIEISSIATIGVLTLVLRFYFYAQVLRLVVKKSPQEFK